MGNSSRAADTRLISSTCRLVERLPCCMATFSPDGNLVAGSVFAPAEGPAVKLFRAADGRQIFAMTCSSLLCQPPGFNELGNQLAAGDRIMCFGLDEANTGRCRQLCNAISAASSWVSTEMENMYERLAIA